MTILWCGGEDTDFPNGTVLPVAAYAGSGSYRSGYARHSITSTTAAYLRSNAFAGGSVTSCWYTFRMWTPDGFPVGYGAGTLIAGLTKDNTTAAGLWLATSSSDGGKFTLVTYDGSSTVTVLASEAGDSCVTGSVLKIDMHVASYGSSSTVTVYVNGTSIITFSGNCTVSGVTSLSAAALQGWFEDGAGAYSGHYTAFSEFIVADSDTRNLGLATLAPNGAGGTNAWSGNYTNIDEAANSTSAPLYTNATGQTAEFTMNGLPSGTFTVEAVKISASASSTSGATATQVSLGFYNGSGSGSTGLLATTTAWETLENIFASNPITSAAWAQSDISSLQFKFVSG